MIMPAVGVKRKSPPPKIIFAIEFVIAILRELKISIMIAAIRHISVLFIPEICECCNFVIPLQRPIDENA